MNIDPEHWIWRGQSDSSWNLLASAFRSSSNRRDIVEFSLARFQHLCGGKYSLDQNMSEDDWWVLGRHNGLATPLLDFTFSPFVAVFFAFHEAVPGAQFRSTWGLHLPTLHKILHKSESLRRRKEDLEDQASQIWKQHHTEDDKGNYVVTGQAKSRQDSLHDQIRSLPDLNDTVRIIIPQVTTSARPAAQKSILLKSSSEPIELWWQRLYAYFVANSPDEDMIPMVKLNIPNESRQSIMSGMALMNVTYATLFPDVHGAAMEANALAERARHWSPLSLRVMSQLYGSSSL